MLFHPFHECRLEIPSRGIDAKLLVTTSNHILVKLADFAGMEEPDYDVWTSKRGRDSEAKLCCKILTALGLREWNTWNDVPLEFRKDIERIHRNLGHLLISWRSCFVMQLCQMMQFRL